MKIVRLRIFLLCFKTLLFEEAKQLGFKYAVLEATGPISQHIAQNKFGYKLNNEIKYKDYLFNNEFVFQTIETNESCQLLVKEF